MQAMRDINEAAAALLLQMVAINSENPDMNPDSPGEIELGNFIAGYLQKIELEVEKEEVLPNRFNVYGLLRAENPTPETILIEIHLDTVPSYGCVEPAVKNGCIYGRGSCDTKGGLCASLLALETLAKRKKDLPVNVLLMATVDEEYMYRGALAAIQHLQTKENEKLMSVGAIIGEPTELQVVTAHKACLRWNIQVHGKSVHSSKPDQGIHAIYVMNDIVSMLRQTFDEEIKAKQHSLLGHGTYNIGVIRGGEQVNIIPDFCEITLERRLIPGESPEEVFQSCDDILDRVQHMYPEAKIIRCEPFLRDYTLDTNSNEKIVRKMQQAILSTTGMQTKLQGVPYGSDASKFSNLAKVPSIVFGPGNISYAHSNHEHISIHEVVQAKQIFEELILNWQEE